MTKSAENIEKKIEAQLEKLKYFIELRLFNLGANLAIKSALFIINFPQYLVSQKVFYHDLLLNTR